MHKVRNGQKAESHVQGFSDMLWSKTVWELWVSDTVIADRTNMIAVIGRLLVVLVVSPQLQTINPFWLAETNHVVGLCQCPQSGSISCLELIFFTEISKSEILFYQHTLLYSRYPCTGHCLQIYQILSPFNISGGVVGATTLRPSNSLQ